MVYFLSILNKIHVIVMKINIKDIDDGLNGGLWSLFKADSFAFFDKVSIATEIEMADGDFLVHKAWIENERFPQVKYHFMLGNDLLEVDNSTVKDRLGELLLKYTAKHKKLPFAVIYEKDFKNGSVQMNYQPAQYQNFAIKISPDDYKGDGDLISYLKSMPAETENPLAAIGDLRLATITPMRDSALVRSFAVNGSVSIEDAVVTDINLKSEIFQEHETISYLIQVKGGFLTDGKKGGRKEPLEVLNFRISDNLYENTKLVKGDKVTLKGKISVNKNMGFILQNIRKIVKS